MFISRCKDTTRYTAPHNAPPPDAEPRILGHPGVFASLLLLHSGSPIGPLHHLAGTRAQSAVPHAEALYVLVPPRSFAVLCIQAHHDYPESRA